MTQLRDPSEHLHPRARWMWRLGCLTEGAVLVGLLTAASLLWSGLDIDHWWLVAATVVVVAYAIVVPEWRYRVHRWEVTDTAVYTQTGWWARERRIAPMSRIQTVDYTEGPMERLFGLATVKVTTASAAGALTVAGLARDHAQQLSDQLTVQADAVPGDGT